MALHWAKLFIERGEQRASEASSLPSFRARFVLRICCLFAFPDQQLWGCAGRAMWAAQAGAAAIIGASVAALEAPARQVGSLSSAQRQTQFTASRKEGGTTLPTNKSDPKKNKIT